MKFSHILINVPFAYMWILRKIAGNPRTVIDLGCGDGEIMRIIGDKNWEVTGVDIYTKSLQQAKQTGMYEKLIEGDLVTVVKQLVKEKKKYDLVFCSQVIEHVTRKDGEELLELSEKLAKKRIFFGTPNGFLQQPEVFIKGNPHQHHKSGWTIEDFTKRGFTVHGIGLKQLWSEEGIARTNNRYLEFLITSVAFLLNPLLYYVPSLAAGVLAVKDVES